MTAYYNEIDPQAAQWLRNLIAAGMIAPGDVDERSIVDVRPDDLRGYTQCHFFAGIGVWSYALRQAGWSDDRPVWTGSCPCQPFSSAGTQAGFADERHLWPHFFRLIRECRPTEVFGEQVASKAVEPWIDLVQTDLEGVGYVFAGIPFPSAGVGVPHIRDRFFWVADAHGGELQGVTVLRGAECDGEDTGRSQGSGEPRSCGEVLRLGDTCGAAGQRDTRGIPGKEAEKHRARIKNGRCVDGFEHAGPGMGRLADADGEQHHRGWIIGQTGRSQHPDGRATAGGESASGPVNGFWGTADWLLCRDGKWRPVEPGTFPLVDGAPARVVRLRGYGNAINAEAGRAFIEVLTGAEIPHILRPIN